MILALPILLCAACLDFARTEFAKHLPGTGIALELKVDGALGADAFRVRERGGALEVTGGNERGCLYGVYSFLESECGARFYTSWCSKPAVAPAAVPRGLDRTERPAFEARMPYWWDVIYHPEFAAKLRVNANPFNPMPDFVGGNACRFGKGMPSCHTLGSLLPDAHNLCLTDATNLAVVTERVLARIAADPDARFYGISYDDNLAWCRCPRCEAVNREEGTPAGTLVRFVNAVADVVAEKFPKATLETLAYQHTVVPPKKTRLRKNVIVCLCSNKCEFTYPFEESPFEENREFVQAMRDWGRMSPLYVWDYTTCFCGYPKPFPNGAVLLKNIRFFRDHGVRYLFEQGDYQGVHADFGEWKAYLEAKAMWNPDLDEEALRKDFFAGYYGAGAPFADAYYRKAIAAHRAETDRTRHRMIFGSEEPLPFCTPAFIAEGRALWAQADAATRADRLANYNVRMSAMSLDFQELLMEFAKPAQDLVRQRELAARIRACIVEARPKTLTLLEFPQALLGRINALMDRTEDVTGVEAEISARWIGAERDDRRFVRFKNVFESDGSALRLHVAADDASVLYVDARRIGRGDAAGGGKSYRSYDLSLTPGRHKLEAVVFVGPGSRKPPTLLVQAEGGHYGPQLTTGIGKWRARTFDNVEFRDASVFIDGDSPWDDFWDAFVGGTKAADGEDVRSLRPSRRPPEKGEPRQSLYVETPLEIPAKTTKRILWDLGEERCAYPEMSVAPGTGAGLRFRWEWLDGPSSEKAAIADESQHLGGAGGEGFTTPWPRRGRACRLTFTTGDKPATVSRIAIEEVF